MKREKILSNCLSDLMKVNHQATSLLETAGNSRLGEVSNLHERRIALRSFRLTLGEMKWLCLQMEIVLAEAPVSWKAANDQ